MQRNYYTLTYSDDILKLVKVSGKNIVAVISSEIPPGVVNGGKIDRIKIFADLIIDSKNKAQPHKITDNEIIAAVPEEKVFLKTVEIPKMPLEKIDSTIAWQIGSLIPFKQTEVYFNWKIVGSVDEKLLILVSVCERKIVDSLLETLSVAKQKPLIVTFPSAGLANLLAQKPDPTLIVDLSRKNNIALIIAKSGDIHFSTSRHIGDEFKGLEKIIQDAVHYYQSKYPLKENVNVVIFGPPELEKLEKKVTNFLAEKNKITSPKDIRIISNIKEKYLIYIDNLGLNLSLESLSILPPEIRANAKNESVNYRLASIVNYFILLLLFILITYAVGWAYLYYQNLKINKDYANILTTQTTSEQKDLETNINIFNRKISIINSIPFNDAIKPSFIEKIISAGNENIIFKEISVEANKNVKIKGIAKSRNDLIIFKDKLNGMGIMNPINLPITTLEKKENIDFELLSVKQ